MAAVLVLVRSSAVWSVAEPGQLCHPRLSRAGCGRTSGAFDNAAELLCLLSLSLQTGLLSVWPPPIDSRPLLSALLCYVAVPVLLLLAAPLLRHWLARQGASAAVKRSARLEQDDGRL